MIVSARTLGLDGLARRLESELAPRVSMDAVEAAAAALAREAAREGVAIDVEARGLARIVGSADPAAVAREVGTLELPPAPWLAPALAALRRRP